MEGKTVIVTGAGSGLGLETADALARKGAALVLIEIDPARGEAAVARISESGPSARLFVADLSLQADIRRVAGEILASTPRIDVLVNNAGAMFTTRQVTADGLERTFALNHLGYFLLTNLLLERIIASAPARIVSMASSAHRKFKLDFDDLQAERQYSSLVAYGRSKLANVLFTRSLARRLAGTGVTANCLAPGHVASHFFDDIGGGLGLLFSITRRVIGITPAEGAVTAINMASSSEVEGITGKYFVKRRIVNVFATAQDDAVAERLWAESLRLTGLAGEEQSAQERQGSTRP
jgi:NAD(P)-dependent dehydrogenase (short-subunit alcohol dehydrogenase family)